ncbi:MAG: RNA-binding protein [Pseudomonadota bacterium]|nr:RNA-binding protein [Pseudomonadota bacterium]
MNIYVGNLSYSVSRDELKTLFAEFGAVRRATVVTDKETQRSKGFGFVEMDDDTAAKRAMEKLHGHEINGRPLRVNEANARDERRRPQLA